MTSTKSILPNVFPRDHYGKFLVLSMTPLSSRNITEKVQENLRDMAEWEVRNI